MVTLLIDTYRTAEHQPGRLRGELTSHEIKTYVAICLKPDKYKGPNRCPNELTKKMTDAEFQNVRMRVNDTLTQGTSLQRATINGIILQLHRGGGTDETSDQRPVVLLKSVYQLLNYVINERLKKNVNSANILEPGQGGGRQGHCVSIDMQKVHFIQQEARRQGTGVYRVEIDFKNAFNAKSQAALWFLMRMFKITEFDLLEQIYEGTTVRLAPNNKENATITFDTGVMQGSITSLQLFNIFINALLLMITVTGQNEDISHGLQIGKDQKGDNQRDDNGDQFNNIGFIDDISIFAYTPEGMQKLLSIIQEFTAWCGMQINVKETYLLVIDNDQKRREQEPALAIDNQRKNSSSDESQ